MQAYSITVIDSRGFRHNGIQVSPPSRQPTPAAGIAAGVASGFDRPAIMRAAWAHYRLRRTGVFAAGDETGHRNFIRSIFAKALSITWAEAKKRTDAERRLAAARADHMAIVAGTSRPRLSGPAALGRIAEIENELRVVDFSDAWAIPTADRQRNLRAELLALMAAHRRGNGTNSEKGSSVTNLLGRRNVVRALPFIGALAIAPVIMAQGLKAPPSGDDAELLLLGQKMDRLIAAENAAKPADLYNGDWTAWEAAHEQTDPVVHKIVDLPARSLEGFQIKARAIAWCYGSDDVGFDAPTTDLQLANAIIRDLLIA